MTIIKLPLPSPAPNFLPFPLPFPLLKKLEFVGDFCSREENQRSKGAGGEESYAPEEYTPLLSLVRHLDSYILYLRYIDKIWFCLAVQSNRCTS